MVVPWKVPFNIDWLWLRLVNINNNKNPPMATAPEEHFERDRASWLRCHRTSGFRTREESSYRKEFRFRLAIASLRIDIVRFASNGKTAIAIFLF